MPPEQPIAGGAKPCVRDTLRWAFPALKSSVSSPSVSSVDSEETSSEADSDSEDSLASSLASSSPVAIARTFPPSPPVLPIVDPLLKVVSPAGSHGSADHFNDQGHTFLDRVFPRSKVLDRAIAIDAPESAWQLALLDQGVGGDRIMYAYGAEHQALNLRQNLMGLLDMADEDFGCDQLVVVLDKEDQQLATTLHSLIYVGGAILTPNAASLHKKHSSDFILVGIEL